MNTLLVFARAPVLGTVKTRLAATIGEAAALALYQALLADTCAVAQAAGVARRVLCVAGDVGNSGLGNLVRAHQMELVPQSEGDLGARMSAACAEAFAAGATRVVVIGSDAPLLDAPTLRAAFLALAQRRVVLGPASDGGYYLVGLAAPRPELFAGVAWSTARVLTQTLARLEPGEAALLPMLRDLDDADDLEWLRALLPHLPATVAPATRARIEAQSARITRAGS